MILTPMRKPCFITRLFYVCYLLNLWASCAAQELWVNNSLGKDTAIGTAQQPLASIQAALQRAPAGTLIHVQAGTYRESELKFPHNGTPEAPIILRGEGKVQILGSERIAHWHALDDTAVPNFPTAAKKQIFWADLSAWQLQTAPRFVLQTDAQGKVVSRFKLAREPDWRVATPWKVSEFWWTAQGGSAPANCAPQQKTACDKATRSLNQLSDAVNLTQFGDLTGATLVALDSFQGHYIFHRPILAHDVAAGKITVARKAFHDNEAFPGLGWGSRYYVENHPALLDSPQEYWFDINTGRLYVWAEPEQLPNLEISRAKNAIDLSGTSYIHLENLSIAFYNQTVIKQSTISPHKSLANHLQHLNLTYANRAILLEHVLFANAPKESETRGFQLTDSQIAHMDTDGFYAGSWWGKDAAIAEFTHAPITETLISGNTFEDLAFNSQFDNAVGLSFGFADKLKFIGNRVAHIAHNGIQFSWAVQRADGAHTGEILLKDNEIVDACELATDCGGVKFWGTPPDKHIFQEVLLIGNRIHHQQGWSSIAAQRGRWTTPEHAGFGGFGLYLDFATGIHAYQNHFYDNSWAGILAAHTWRDGALILVNNRFENSQFGVDIWNDSSLKAVAHDTQILHNSFLHNSYCALRHTATAQDTRFMHNYNSYSENKALLETAKKTFYNLEQVQATGQEQHGQVLKNPADFAKTSCVLPESLRALLKLFALPETCAAQSD